MRRRLGRKTRWLAARSTSAVADKKRKPGQIAPSRSRKTPSSSGGKNPPRPPSAPTSPVTVPVSFGKVLRHELEDRAVAEAHQQSAPERADRERHHRRPRQQQREQGHAAEHPRQHLRAADAVRQPPADGPHQRREHDESGRAQSRIRGSQAELRAQQCRQVDREGHEAAEGQEVEGAEQPGRRRAPQDRHHRGDRRRSAGMWRIPRHRKYATAHASSSALVPRKTTCQPSRAATTGPTNTARDCPIVPRPYTPRAVP